MRKDTKKKNFWINNEQDIKLKNICSKSGITEKEFFVRCIEGKTIAEKPGKEFYEAVKQIRGVAINLNQIAAKANKMNFIDAQNYKKMAQKVDTFLVEMKEKFLIGKN